MKEMFYQVSGGDSDRVVSPWQRGLCGVQGSQATLMWTPVNSLQLYDNVANAYGAVWKLRAK